MSLLTRWAVIARRLTTAHAAAVLMIVLLTINSQFSPVTPLVLMTILEVSLLCGSDGSTGCLATRLIAVRIALFRFLRPRERVD